MRTAVLLMSAALLAAGCATAPPAPLVPLPDALMPTAEDLRFRAWRVVVAEAGGPQADLERVFTAELKNQLGRYGIRNVNSDAVTSELLARMLQVQAASGEAIRVSDLQYERANVDGVISVRVTAVTVPRRNEVSSWTDKKTNKTHYTYTSEVDVSGYYTLVIPETGLARTVQFSQARIERSSDRPHQFSERQLALEAVKQAAASGQTMSPIYERFPLVGFVIGEGERSRDVLVNRGANHGVRRDRKWAFLLREQTVNALVGTLETEREVGTGRTVEVYADTCVVRCDSSRTRERAKLGMKVRAEGFGFSLAGLFGM